MFELEREVRNWRRGLERKASLSPLELDELDDHLRALVSLEHELDPALTPAGAFAVALEQLGEPTAISKEFARAGRSRWRRLLLAGWALYAVSFFLPTGYLPAEAQMLTDFFERTYGYELFWAVVTFGNPFGVLPNLLVLLPNLAMIMTLAALFVARPSRRRRFLRSLQTVAHAGIGLTSLGIGAFMVLRPMSIPLSGGLSSSVYPGLACWVWSASFVYAAVALWLRNREWVPARLKNWAAQPGLHGVSERPV